MKTLSANATIGILGGGQLARMMAASSAKLGFKTLILDPMEHCPAAQTANGQIVAAYEDEGALLTLAQNVDVITYEFENIPLATLNTLENHAPIYPRPFALEVSQDRVVEKIFFNDCGIETAPWYKVDDGPSLAQALAKLGHRAILKTRTLGYDGKGQTRFETPDQDKTEALSLLKQQSAILEGFVDFVQEISVIGVRHFAGDIVFYDIGQNIHKNGILRQSIVPALIKEKTRKQALDSAKKIADKLDYVGVFAIEFFVKADGGLVVNEMAPRVHNSGHWTEAACYVSQFEQHIRAIAGLPLGDVGRHSDCVMENLIGDDIAKVPTFLADPMSLVTLYGKAETRPGRKMGHVNHIKGRVLTR